MTEKCVCVCVCVFLVVYVWWWWWWVGDSYFMTDVEHQINSALSNIKDVDERIFEWCVSRGVDYYWCQLLRR